MHILEQSAPLIDGSRPASRTHAGWNTTRKVDAWKRLEVGTLVPGMKIVATLVVALSPAMMHEQSYGSLVGSVTENTGALVPNASVTLANSAAGEKRPV